MCRRSRCQNLIPVYGFESPDGSGLANGLAEVGRELGATDFSCAQRRQVPGVLLAIDHLDLLGTAKSHQCSQCHLGSVASVGEHGFTKHHASQVDAVQAPNEFTVYPGFHAVGMPGAMQGPVGSHHVGHDPGARLACPGRAGTSADDSVKGTVKPDLAARIG